MINLAARYNVSITSTFKSFENYDLEVLWYLYALYLVSNSCHFDLPLPRNFNITGAQFYFSRNKVWTFHLSTPYFVQFGVTYKAFYSAHNIK